MMKELPNHEIDRPHPAPASKGITESVGTVFEEQVQKGCPDSGDSNDSLNYLENPFEPGSHISPKKSRYIEKIIDADEANAALALVAALKSRVSRKHTRCC